MLVAMSEAEIETCVERVLGVFADALSRAKGWGADEAIEKARAHVATRLPPDRAGHHFMNIVADGDTLGSLWFAEQFEESPKRIYIFDIEVHREHRGKRIGSRALKALEGEARALGAEEIALAVFGFNTGAIRLYERLGYVAYETGAAGKQMAKRL